MDPGSFRSFRKLGRGKTTHSRSRRTRAMYLKLQNSDFRGIVGDGMNCWQGYHDVSVCSEFKRCRAARPCTALFSIHEDAAVGLLQLHVVQSVMHAYILRARGPGTKDHDAWSSHKDPGRFRHLQLEKHANESNCHFGDGVHIYMFDTREGPLCEPLSVWSSVNYR